MQSGRVCVIHIHTSTPSRLSGCVCVCECARHGVSFFFELSLSFCPGSVRGLRMVAAFLYCLLHIGAHATYTQAQFTTKPTVCGTKTLDLLCKPSEIHTDDDVI